jgi:DNA-binding NarL/FixJ family response regulator
VNIKNPKKIKYLLHFFIIDNDTTFANKVSRSLNPDPDYEIEVFQDKKEFLEIYNSTQVPDKNDKIHVIIIDSDQLESNEDFELINTIKKINRNAEIVILTSHDNSKFSDTLTSGVYAIIPKNDNVFYRIENTAKGIKSLHLFLRKRRTMKISLFAFAGFILIILILFVFFRFSS